MWVPDTFKGLTDLFSMMGRGLQDAQRGVGVVFRPSWTDQLIASACFVEEHRM